MLISLDGPIPADACGDFLAALERGGVLDAQAAQRARAAMAQTGQDIDVVLTELGMLAEGKLADALASFLGLERAGPADFPPDLPTGEEVEHGYLKNSGLLPLAMTDIDVSIATARPLNRDSADALGYFLGRRVGLKVAAASELALHMARLLDQVPASESAPAGGDVPIDGDIERLRDIAREAPIIKLVGALIAKAVERGASDIHIEPQEDHVRVRFRIDGALRIAEVLDKRFQPGVISRIKILAGLNIAEYRLPQDGRIKLPVRGREIDLRVSTVPALHGESVVLRILDRQDSALDLAALGFSAGAAGQIGRLIGAPNGIVLVTGPTGSGKTTTLYAALAALSKPDVKVLTVEDPVELHLNGVSQIHVRQQIGLDFAAVLRSVLRQDPDIIMVGEIRDAETARIAIQASLTGHLVLSSLHTNSAAASITRLLDMGTEDFLLASTIRGIVAQRLVRKLCPSCKARETPTRPVLDKYAGLRGASLYGPRGCPQCGGTGYRGRTVIYEIIEMTGPIKELVSRRAGDQEVHRAAQLDGMTALIDCGIARAAAGQTSLAEVLRAVDS